jgi:FkbM family methyltransferase
VGGHAAKAATVVQMSVRSAIKSVIRTLGYDIRRAEMGQDPFRDIADILCDTPSPLVLDVGANSGQTISQLLAVLKQPIIHAFEPGRLAFLALQDVHGGRQNVTLNQLALGMQRGAMRLNENSESKLSSLLSLAVEWGSIQDSYDVDVLTPDEYCAANSIRAIDLLKIDTQGFDMEVLKGGHSMVSSGRVRLILIELHFYAIYNGSPRPDQIYGLLADVGFELISFYKMWFRDGRAGWTDALFKYSERRCQ